MTRTEELRARHGQRGHAVHSARKLLVGAVGSDPYATIEDLERVGRKKAEAEGVAYQLEKETKSVLARVATDYARDRLENLSEAKLERLARADQRYLDHLKGVAVAIERRELAHSEYWAIKSELEWDRAALAHLNAMSRLGEPV